jgi:geranylgeranyl pyrophosphate synthase
MSRLARYRESLNKFIKDRSCLLESNNIPNAILDPILYNKIKNHDLMIPILFLTVMNSQNKKNQITLQGYYGASAIEFLHVMLDFIENKENMLNLYGNDNYGILVNYLTLCAYKSICQNLESIKSFVKDESVASIFMQVLNVYNNVISYSNLLSEHQFEISSDKPNNDVVKWYLKNNIELGKKFSKLDKIKLESYQDYLNKKIGSLCELAMTVGWLMGCGSTNSKELQKVRKASKYFAVIYKLSLDFHSIDKDLETSKNITTNFVLNYGLQESYELFMYNKQKFIEEAMMLDIYTTTVKEIINYIEHNVDQVIDETSPDLKSNLSNINSESNC